MWMYQAREVNVPSQESECTKSGKLARYIHFPGLIHSLSWLGTFTFLARYIHFPGLIHSPGKWMYQARKVNVPSQESECTNPGKRMYHARKVNVPNQESECIKQGKWVYLARKVIVPSQKSECTIHFPDLVHSLSWLGTLTFLVRYIHFPD
jgi:uncharacterized membrane protein (DUF485 family)